MTSRATILLCLVCLALPAGARAQGDSFGPLPPPRQSPTAEPAPAPNETTDDGDLSRATLFAIGGGLLAVFVAIGIVITRDARRTLPEDKRRPDMTRDEGPHKAPKQAKSRARKKNREQRRARRRQRKRSR